MRQRRDLVAIPKHMRELRALAETVSDGRPSATKARAVARVARPDTDAAWTERACVRAHFSQVGRSLSDDWEAMPSMAACVRVERDGAVIRLTTRLTTRGRAADIPGAPVAAIDLELAVPPAPFPSPPAPPPV